MSCGMSQAIEPNAATYCHIGKATAWAMGNTWDDIAIHWLPAMYFLLVLYLL
jgi:hypothetical protein